MDPNLFNAVKFGKVIELRNLIKNNPNILDQVTPIEDTPFHIAARNGCLEIVKVILDPLGDDDKLTHISKSNKNDDSPFHLAARGNHLDVVKYFIDCVKVSPLQDVENGQPQPQLEILRMVNKAKNTVMHEAVTNCNLEMVKMLITEDKELLCMVNDVGESPLHMAVDKGNLDIVKQMLPHDNCSYQGPNGQTALHSAITLKNEVITEMLLAKNQDLVKMVDNNGRTPLHFASALGFVTSVKKLLQCDTSAAYLLDKNGHAPVHMSAHGGHIDIIKEFLEHCPDLKYLLDRRRRNIFHIAVGCKQVHLVRYILKETDLKELLNEKDVDGNSPLHQAAIASHPYIVYLLVKDKMVDSMAVNNKQLTALDIARFHSQTTTERRQAIILALLVHRAKPPWCNNEDVSEIFRSGVERMQIGWYSKKANTLLVVAALVATVTFAAGFSMPGGYKSSGSNQGTASLINQQRFRRFVIFNALAMYASSAAVVSLIWVQFIYHLSITILVLYFAQILTIAALSLMTLAFMEGVCLSVAENSGLRIFLYIFGYGTICIILAATIIQHISPYLYACKRYTFFRAWAYRFAVDDFTALFTRRKCLNDVSWLFIYDNSQLSTTPGTLTSPSKGSKQV